MKEYKVGQRIIVKPSGGRIVEAVIRAVVETSDGWRLNIAFDNEAAQVWKWQVVEPK